MSPRELGPSRWFIPSLHLDRVAIASDCLEDIISKNKDGTWSAYGIYGEGDRSTAQFYFRNIS